VNLNENNDFPPSGFPDLPLLNSLLCRGNFTAILRKNKSRRCTINELLQFLPKKTESEHRGKNRAYITIRDSLSRLDLRAFFQHHSQHPERISLSPKKWNPFTVSYAKIKKGPKLLDDFVVRAP
jgi:hypothetical protein